MIIIRFVSVIATCKWCKLNLNLHHLNRHLLSSILTDTLGFHVTTRFISIQKKNSVHFWKKVYCEMTVWKLGWRIGSLGTAMSCAFNTQRRCCNPGWVEKEETNPHFMSGLFLLPRSPSHCGRLPRAEQQGKEGQLCERMMLLPKKSGKRGEGR